MKRMLCLIMAVMLFFTGCQLSLEAPTTEETAVAQTQTDPADVPMTTPEETTAETEPVIYEQQTMYAISMPIIQETVCDDDGTVIFQHNHQDMHLVIPDKDVADCIIVDYLNRMDEISKLVEGFAENAQSQYSSSDVWIPHYYDIYYNPTRIDSEVLSLFSTGSSYTGSRPVQTCSALNYSMLTGDVLTLGSILRHIDSKALLVDLVIEKADAIYTDAQLFSDYTDYITERFEKEESFDEDWYFSDTGLCFYFSPYEIAPYSSGIITLEIPYDELTGIIAAEFFPPEEEPMYGMICEQSLAEADMDHYTQVARISLAETEEQYLLYADGAISDIRIEVCSGGEDDSVFIPLCTVLSSSTLTPNDGIVIQPPAAEDKLILRISYRSGEERYFIFLTQAGLNGPLLTEN